MLRVTEVCGEVCGEVCATEEGFTFSRPLSLAILHPYTVLLHISYTSFLLAKLCTHIVTHATCSTHVLHTLSTHAFYTRPPFVSLK